MYFLKHKKKLALCCLIVLLLCAGCNNRIRISDAVISFSYGSTKKLTGLIVVSIGDGLYLIIDTGASMSIIFSDRIEMNSRRMVGQSVVNRKDTLPIKRVDVFQIGDLVIKNHNFIFAKAKNTIFDNDATIAGIIGMDILSQKHTFFDIKNQTITFSDEKNVQYFPPDLVFNYKLPNRPLVKIQIDKTMFQDVLFDTGLNCFLMLLEKDKAKFNNQRYSQQISSADFFGSQRVVYGGQFDSIRINEMYFINQTISFGARRTRLLGMEFVRQFSGFLIDPFERKIKFFE